MLRRLHPHDVLEKELVTHRYQRNMLRKIADEAMAAWEASKKPTKTLTTQHSDPNAAVSGAEPKPSGGPRIVVRDSRGDSSFLDAALRALDDLRKVDERIAECESRLRAISGDLSDLLDVVPATP